MNFEFMPEIHYEYGYLLTVTTMIILAIVMIGFFKHKRWL
jgi:magnesium transporter